MLGTCLLQELLQVLQHSQLSTSDVNDGENGDNDAALKLHEQQNQEHIQMIQQVVAAVLYQCLFYNCVVIVDSWEVRFGAAHGCPQHS